MEFLKTENFTLDVDDGEELVLLETSLPSVRDSIYIVIPMTIIYSTILLTGLLGNTITCIVIYKVNYMHTSTNYYLLNLALSDLLLLICGLPQEIYLICMSKNYK